MKPGLRERVLTEWRGLPQRMPEPDRFQPASVSLERVMEKLGLTARLRESEVLAAWNSLVGDFIAQHSRPHRLRDGTLYIQVLQPTLHYELDRVWKPQILRKFKERFGRGTIREIRFQVG